MSKRRDSKMKEKFKDILDTVSESKTALNASDLSRLTGIHNYTVRNYLEIINLIYSYPKLPVHVASRGHRSFITVKLNER